MARPNKNTVLQLSEPVEAAYMAAVDRLVINIAKHLGSGTAFRTASWETAKLAELGQLTEENAKIINAALKDVPNDVRDALDEISRLSLESIDKAIEEAIAEGRMERAPSDSVKEMVTELSRQAVDQANLVNTVMLESSRSAYLQAVQNTVIWTERAMDPEIPQGILNEAATAATAATETRTQALKKAISQMADNGIYGFVDRAGRHWSPEAYINMDIRTTVHNAAIEAVRNRQQDYGSSVFQISSHPGARPLCYPYQGKFYSWDGSAGVFADGAGAQHPYYPIETTSYGQPAGIFGINCGHYPLPQIPGITIPSDQEEENKAENDRLYAESQEQRGLERSVREAKRKAVAYQAAGLADAFAEESVKVKQRQEEYAAFCKRVGRTPRIDRIQVDGYNKNVSRKATAAAKRIEAEKLLKANMMATGALPKEAKIHLNPIKINIPSLSFDDKHINGERAHKVTEKEAKKWIENALFSTTVWKGQFERFYSKDGAAYVNRECHSIRTAFSSADYDEKTKALIEVFVNAKAR